MPIRDKEFGIAETFRHFDAILEEAKKCELVCANCHAEIHAGFV